MDNDLIIDMLIDKRMLSLAKQVYPMFAVSQSVNFGSSNDEELEPPSMPRETMERDNPSYFGEY